MSTPVLPRHGQSGANLFARCTTHLGNDGDGGGGGGDSVVTMCCHVAE
ncbi:MAG: hypothetical protein FWF18_03580 [Dehalococcoidia bacterium]|nr:hypothetical protein [Dehalococcoidia bacterium]